MTAPGCRRAVCTEVCRTDDTDPVILAGMARRASRWAALVLAAAMGSLMLTLVAVIPGHGRLRRTGWALQRVCTWTLRACGVRTTVSGAPRSGPSLVVGNHCSWLDVVALSASARMLMLAKSEVGTWPLIGAAARRTGTLFLQRSRLRQLPETVNEITAALRSGHRVQVFPEGTTRCGGAVNEFRRAAFQAAIDAGVVVSPVTLRYLDSTGSATSRPAFLGEETLAASIRRVIGMRALTVVVHWLPAVPAIAGTGRAPVDRALVARLAQNAVARDLRVPVVRGRGSTIQVTTGQHGTTVQWVQERLAG